MLYLGRGSYYPLALEGALKLKEISYIHAEGYAAGELKHGPIALIDETVPVIVVAPRDALYDKTISNMQEVAARGGQIILITSEDAALPGTKLAAQIRLPKAHGFIAPILYALAGAVARLSHGGAARHRCGPAAQSGEIGDGRVAGGG